MIRTRRRPRPRPGTPAAVLARRAGRPSAARHADAPDAGFTLVEAIVSLTLFAIVSAAAVLALVTGIRGENDTSDRVTAAQLAQQATDRARAMPRAALTAVPSTSSPQPVGGKTYTVTRVVTAPTPACPAANETLAPGDVAVRKIIVHVEVTTPDARPRVIRMDSVIAC